MRDIWTRRHFLNTAAASTAALALNAPSLFAAAPDPLRGRFITHVSVVRVNQIEVTPTRNLGLDEAPDNSPAHIRSRREAFARGCANNKTGGRMTWAISWLALIDQRQQYKDARRLLASYHDRYGDEITFIPGGYFAPMFDTRENNRQTIHKALNMVSEMVGNKYRPQSLVAGFLDSENQRHLAEDEGIHVCQGQIWSQHGIDNGDGDGGICYPYYPSREHYLKPAQDLPGAANSGFPVSDFVDSVCLDGWTCDFLAARREGFEGGFNSRLGVGPIETVGNLGLTAGRREMMDTTAMHFDTGHALNGFGWVTGIWEVSVGHDEDLTYWLQTIHDRWPDTQVITEGEFGLEWRKNNPSNAVNYRFDAKGTGAPGSEKNLELEWFMNKEFRLALLHDWTTHSQPLAIDFTRYDLPTSEPRTPQREWSLKNVLNQKGSRPNSEDKPRRLSQLSPAHQHVIFTHYPDLKSRA